MFVASQPRVRAPECVRVGGKRLFPVVAAFMLAIAGCGGGGESRTPDAGPRDAPVTGDVPVTVDTPGGNEDRPVKQIGEPCGTASECASEFCAEGVCCNTACTDACFSCVSPGAEGTCLPSAAGTNPGQRCPTETAAVCGRTGVCDGTGACARFGAGVICEAGGCTGSTLTASGTCDATGTCAGTTSQSCTPYVCGTNGACRTNCSTDADCLAPNTCIGGSCGKKPIGAGCGADAECNSSVCAQGRCCSVACTGTCKSCAIAGSEGTCRNVPDNQDPLGQCDDQGMMTCGLDGMCNGMGACRKYPANIVCGTDSCTGGTAMLAARCTTAGACGTPMLQNCSPYVCGATTCKTSCATTADCAAGFTCIGSICAKKPNGATCGAANECESNYCQQGVCCNTGCAGTCMACNLATTMGTCSPIAPGQPPVVASQCPMMASTSCGTDGMCNGAGACRNYAAGTACGGPSCTGSTLSSARTCDGAGVCRPPTMNSCTPYTCAAAGTACRTTCAATSECVTGNTCVAMSCGKIPIGGLCPSGVGTDCASGFCVQGVCCNTACTGTCMACSTGTCSPVSAGAPPVVAGQCRAAAASTCGNDGTCNGAGACRKHVMGTQCVAASCTGSTYKPPQLCDGAGACAAAATQSCVAFQCDATAGICRNTCSMDAHCVPPNICNGTTCSLKPIGATCTAAAECNSGFCAQGRCCDTACTGTCKTCALATALGTCSNVPNGTAPVAASQCLGTAATTCGLEGVCNGAGACRLWAAGTQCVAGSCTGSTLIPARTCDGTGACRTVTSSLCDPYQCASATACKTSCTTAAADCVAPNSCVSMSCGKLPVGATCAADNQCNSNFCAQGVCCTTACAGTCASCALTGSVGTCTSVPAGQDPLNQCTDSGVAMCGTDGACNGSGACRRYASGVTCVPASCPNTANVQPGSTCNTSGTCVTPATVPCTPYVCSAGACKTSCTSNADCQGPTYVCTGTTCGSATMVSVQLAARELSPNNAAIMPDFKLYNTGTTPIPLSEITLRYWFTRDTAIAQTAWCDFATLGAANITLTLAAVSPARTNADYYFQVGFAPASGNLAAGANTGNIQTRFSKDDFSNYNEANDYSYVASMSFGVTTKVTVYRLGNLVYGTEP